MSVEWGGMCGLQPEWGQTVRRGPFGEERFTPLHVRRQRVCVEEELRVRPLAKVMSSDTVVVLVVARLLGAVEAPLLAAGHAEENRTLHIATVHCLWR